MLTSLLLAAAQPVLHAADRPYERITFEESIEVRDASFTYPGKTEPVLRDIDLRIPFGSSYAFVGGSGAGKTTLVDLVIGFHHAQRGGVYVDGVELEANPRGWWDNVAFVPQSVTVVNGTVLHNVLLDVEAAQTTDRAEVERVLREAQLGQWLDELPDGLDTVIGEGAVGVSGGQRQRLGIARALFRRPRLLVLDEATSALDNLTERRVTEVIESLRGPAGSGDIRMSPQRVQGYEIVEIEIRSTDGRAILEVDRDLLTEFVDASTALVPVGEEPSHMDLDAEINKITSRAV